MAKELYDAHMFNYMWESLDQDRFVVGTYYIEDNKPDWDFVDHLGQVQRLALEGSTASWMDVKEETPELRERLSSKVLGYYEVAQGYEKGHRATGLSYCCLGRERKYADAASFYLRQHFCLL